MKHNLISHLLVFLAIAVLLTNCKKEEKETLPQLTTADVINITDIKAYSGGNVTSDGGSPVTNRGICWSSMANPTVDDLKTTDGSGIGTFTSEMNSLSEGLTYHVRAYATNSIGTAYGEDFSFSTLGKPILTTMIISNITLSSAESGANITSDGGTPIIAQGLCWNNSENPTIADSLTSEGSGIGSFSSVMNGLNLNTTYHVRAYATNTIGTGYGEELTFTTMAAIDIDGNLYHSISIGSQIWLVENLKTITYRNGDPITNITVGMEWSSVGSGAYCNYNNEETMADTYGRLYNWYAVVDSRKIAINGWHVPTSAEWDTLITFLGGENVAGGKLKELGFTHWLSPNVGATNSNGFTGLPGGYRNELGTFENVGGGGAWWSTSEHAIENAWFMGIGYEYSIASQGADLKPRGFSVRLLKD